MLHPQQLQHERTLARPVELAERQVVELAERQVAELVVQLVLVQLVVQWVQLAERRAVAELVERQVLAE